MAASLQDHIDTESVTHAIFTSTPIFGILSRKSRLVLKTNSYPITDIGKFCDNISAMESPALDIVMSVEGMALVRSRAKGALNLSDFAPEAQLRTYKDVIEYLFAITSDVFKSWIY